MDIVRFKGGLGNQMFQYALLKSLSLQGRKVMGSLKENSKASQAMHWCLLDVFKNVTFETVDEKIFREIDQQWREIKQNENRLRVFLEDTANRFFWVEEPVGTYNENVFNTNNCTFVGYWQTEKYFIQIKKAILKDFQFSVGEEQLFTLRERLLAADNYISVHIRRGDYLQFQKIYGNICTKQYYKDAIRLMNKEVKNPIFIFFSDDIEWVKEHYKLKNAIYIEADMFEHYQAWYDMCLMSCCSHHIIANSTFSWWGAWLNQRAEKIVIAPKVWQNGYAMPDICPDNWVRL